MPGGRISALSFPTPVASVAAQTHERNVTVDCGLRNVQIFWQSPDVLENAPVIQHFFCQKCFPSPIPKWSGDCESSHKEHVEHE